MDKRGYAVSAPIVAVGIGILILTYLYFLPLNDKCNLIPGLPSCEQSSAETLFSANPGILVPQEVSKRYSIPSTELFRINDLELATIFNEIKVERGWFYSNAGDAEFSLNEGAKEAKLFIVIGDAKGSLNVVVNGRTVSRISGEGVREVNIPIGITEKTNSLKLVPTVPFMPWSSNRYGIAKVTLKERYTKTTNKATYNIEIKQDPNDVVRGMLNFNSECLSTDNLIVTLNDNELIDDIVCSGMKRDIKEYLKKNNTMTFMTEGNYIINSAYLDITIKDNVWPTYYFDISSSRLKSNVPIMLNLYFNETGSKELSVYLNGISISAQTSKMDWKTTINKFLVEGQNSIMFVPRTDVTISKAEVK